MSKIKRLHYKDLNSLRFIAIIPTCIFICLALLKNENSAFSMASSNFFEQMSIGSLDFFFFLSSFLITALALREYKYHNSFSLKKFYLRRLLRVIPILLISFGFAFFFHSKIILFLKLTPINIVSIKSYLLGIPNFSNDYNDNTFVYLLSIWVVFMFLQFYMVWGLVLKFLKDHLMFVGITFIILGVLIRTIYIMNGSNFYYNPLSYSTSIGIGTILAYLLRTKENLKEKIKTFSKQKIRFIYFFGILLLIIAYPMTKSSYFDSLIPIIFSIFFSFILLEQTYAKNSVFKLRNNKIIIRLGKITYGFFIYLPIIATILIIAFESIDKGLESPLYKALFIGSSLVLTWLVADLSYNSIEKIFKAIKHDIKRI